QPRLESLKVDNPQFDNIQTDFSIPASTAHEPVAPLDTQLKELSFIMSSGWQMSELAVPMIKYLLLKLPTLRILDPGSIPKEPIQAFIAKYAQWYPHLEKVMLPRYSLV
ncbi:hypothetical protein H4R19_003037, partial [Coemansia spiralis]